MTPPGIEEILPVVDGELARLRLELSHHRCGSGYTSDSPTEAYNTCLTIREKVCALYGRPDLHVVKWPHFTEAQRRGYVPVYDWRSILQKRTLTTREVVDEETTDATDAPCPL